MDFYIYVIMFFCGSAVGSFLNVVADRYHSGMSFISGKSICFSCGAKIKFLDLVPVISYIALMGRCRKCGHKIPKTLFFSELIMGTLFLLAFLKADFFGLTSNPEAWYLSLVVFLLYVAISGVVFLIALYDLKHFIIPDYFLVIFAVLSIVLNFILGFSIIYIVAAIVLCLPFLILFLLSKGRWLGLGDVKYIFVIGLLLGLAKGLTAVVLAFWIGAAYALIVLGLDKILPRIGLLQNPKGLTMKSEIPFGPFLSLGIILALYFAIDLFSLNSIVLF